MGEVDISVFLIEVLHVYQVPGWGVNLEINIKI